MMFNGQELYRQLQGNYDMMLRRLKNDVIIQSFLKDFIKDKTFEELTAAMRNQDDQAAFYAAHALKGVTLNMEFGFLSKSLSALTEALRGGKKTDADEWFSRVQEDYNRTVQMIQQACNGS